MVNKVQPMRGFRRAQPSAPTLGGDIAVQDALNNYQKVLVELNEHLSELVDTVWKWHGTESKFEPLLAPAADGTLSEIGNALNEATTHVKRLELMLVGFDGIHAWGASQRDDDEEEDRLH